jgi:hypothetical protein
MKTTLAVFAVLLFAGTVSQSAHAQAQIGVPGVGQVTIGQPPPPPPPGYGQAPPHGYDRRAERCEYLRHREHELREQVAYAPYGPERARLEDELRETHHAQDRCWR